MPKKLKKDLQAVKKQLKTLVKMTESLIKVVEKLDAGDAKYSLIKSIRQKASPVLFNQNPEDFIENKQAKKGGKSRYRISVHHDFIHEVDK